MVSFCNKTIAVFMFQKKFELFWEDGHWASTLAHQEPGSQPHRERVEQVEFKGLWWSATEKQIRTGTKSFWSRRPHELASFWYFKTLFSSLYSRFLSREMEIKFLTDFFKHFWNRTKKFGTLLLWIDEITCIKMVRKNVTHRVSGRSLECSDCRLRFMEQ